MSKVFPGYIIVVLNQDICVNIVNFFKKRFSNQCTQIRLYYRLFQMYTNFFTWWISSLPRLSGSEVKIYPKEFGRSYENIHGRKGQTVREWSWHISKQIQKWKGQIHDAVIEWNKFYCKVIFIYYCLSSFQIHILSIKMSIKFPNLG